MFHDLWCGDTRILKNSLKSPGTCSLHTCYYLCVEVPCDQDVLPSQNCTEPVTMKKAFTISQEMYKVYIPGIRKKLQP